MNVLNRLLLSIAAQSMMVTMVRLLRLLQISDELTNAHQMLWSRLENTEQSSIAVIHGHLSSYHTIVNSCIDNVLKVISTAVWLM